MLERWKQSARAIKRDTYALYLACRDPRVPWYAKASAAAVLTYALSPFDLIPDFIPVFGYLDDLLIVPAGLVLVRRMIPADILAEHRLAAELRLDERAPQSRVGAVLIIAIWISMLTAAAYAVVGHI